MHESKKEKKEMVPHYFHIVTVRSPQGKKKDGSFPFQNKRGKENSL